MFKSLSLLIFKTSWWHLLLGGFVIGLMLLWFALPASIEASRWTELTSTPQETLIVSRPFSHLFRQM
jgi:putative effector of murein hydrolase LrgA (UPF0299 family)